MERNVNKLIKLINILLIIISDIIYVHKSVYIKFVYKFYQPTNLKLNSLYYQKIE